LQFIESNLIELIGGTFMGLAAGGMLFSSGRILGVSGILGGILKKPKTIESWRLFFLLGLIIGGVICNIYYKPLNTNLDPISTLYIIVGGFLVGFGTSLGSGCTTGHGICGLSRLSIRSLIATLLFVASGMVTILIIGV
jgi:uncharacterized membrane protein YedE/YeeE